MDNKIILGKVIWNNEQVILQVIQCKFYNKRNL